MAEHKICAALTGDIVRSSKMSAARLDEVRALVVDGVAEAAKWKRGIMRGKADFFRGDSWQALVVDPSFALRVAIFLRARLISADKADSRIAVGIGAVEKISKTRVSLSSGEAFEVSGHALDGMKRRRMTIAAGATLVPSLGPLADWLAATAGLADAIISGWTARQAEVVAAALWPLDIAQETIAGDMSIAQQTVSDTLNAAHFDELSQLLAVFENTAWTESQ
jgi:hypothetical protein